MPVARAPAPSTDRGCYLLVISLEHPCSLMLARRDVALSTGEYGYVGSAQRGLAARIARHRRSPQDKRRAWWHIDHLLAEAEIRSILVYPLARPGECWLAERLCHDPGVSLASPGFGASDCRCPGHLLEFSEPPDLDALRKLALPENLRLRER